MDKKEAQLMILDDVANHYNSSNRSVSHNTDSECLYNGENGNHCAAARWMDEPKLAEEGDSILDEDNFNLLKPEAKLAGKNFMYEIQSLHDNPNFWNESGLSEIGKKEYEIIKLKIEKGFE